MVPAVLPCDHVKTCDEYPATIVPNCLLVFYRRDTIRDDRVSVIDPGNSRFLYPNDQGWGGEQGNGV